MVTTLFVLWLYPPTPTTGYAWFPDKAFVLWLYPPTPTTGYAWAFATEAACEHYQMHSPPVEKWKCEVGRVFESPVALPLRPQDAAYPAEIKR